MPLYTLTTTVAAISDAKPQKREVQNTFQATLLFRSNSLASKLISTYAKLTGGEYLQTVLGDLIQAVWQNPTGFEVDPARLKEGSGETVRTTGRDLHVC